MAKAIYYKQKINSRIKNKEIILDKSSKELYKRIIEQVDNYKESSSGKIGIIHGDPVFTNVIINSKNNIYFIDPRGIVGKKYTILGDIFYDYAKILQSVTGYDFILNDLDIDKNYINEIYDFFKICFVKKFGNEKFDYLKSLTASLYFSLQNFHIKERNKKFIHLARKLI